MFYEIIKNEVELQKFIDFLPELKEGEKFMVALFARNKFKKTDGLTADKTQLKRFVCDKNNIIKKLRHLEVKLGAYTFDIKGKSIPINQESLVVYITPNPRNMDKAAKRLDLYMSQERLNDRTIFNPHALALNAIQTTPIQNKKFFDWDIDIKEGQTFDIEDLTTWLEGKINIEGIGGIIQTRGGFHVLINLHGVSNEFKSSWFLNFSRGADERISVMKNEDNMIPFPGCVQSDFSPILID